MLLQCCTCCVCLRVSKHDMLCCRTCGPCRTSGSRTWVTRWVAMGLTMASCGLTVRTCILSICCRMESEHQSYLCIPGFIEP